MIIANGKHSSLLCCKLRWCLFFSKKNNYFQILRACWFSCASLEKWQVFFKESILSWSTIHFPYWQKSEINHEMISNSAIMDFLLSSLRIDISSEKSQTRRIWSVVLTDNLGHNWRWLEVFTPNELFPSEAMFATHNGRNWVCRLCAIESSVRQLEGRGLVPSACFRGLCPQTGQGPLAEQSSCSAPRIRAPHNHPSLLLHPFQLAR